VVAALAVAVDWAKLDPTWDQLPERPSENASRQGVLQIHRSLAQAP
jgi:hypothetical protein